MHLSSFTRTSSPRRTARTTAARRVVALVFFFVDHLVVVALDAVAIARIVVAIAIVVYTARGRVPTTTTA